MKFTKTAQLLFVALCSVMLLSCEKKENSTDSPVENTPEDMGNSTVADIDGNIYKTVKIGDQWWMAENLRTTKYTDGTLIFGEQMTDNEWYGVGKPAWCNYDNDPLNDTLGKIYNGFTVLDTTRSICPDGWTLPTAEDWIELQITLQPNVGGKLRATYSWQDPHKNTNNESGFTALGTGWRSFSFEHIYNNTAWWTAAKYTWPLNDIPCRSLTGNSEYGLFPQDGQAGYGYCIRCIKK